MKIKSFALVVFVLSFSHLIAQIKLPPIISSNMIMQRNAEVNVWGWAQPNEVVTIKPTWLNKTASTTANKAGFWKIKITTNDDRKAHTITISSKSGKQILKNVLLGEVWLCSGQSNMQMPIKGFPGQPTFGTLEAQLTAHKTKIRQFNITNNGAKEPLDTPKFYTPWTEANAETVLDFGAVSYFFGKQLYEFLDVPIGLIQTARGASSVQAWMSKSTLEEFQKVDLTNVVFDQTNNQKIPTVFFNAMLHPIIPYTIKGAIWYQGEANRQEPVEYTKLFPAMVKDWRSRWEQGDFPFYFVQIAPFGYGNNTSYSSFANSAFMREAQLACVKSIPNAAMAVTLDIGNKNEIHPPKKKEVGDRLALYALNKTYKISGINCEPPTFESIEKKDTIGLFLKFRNTELGLYTPSELEGFDIAGEDKVFYPAKATIINRKLVYVESKMVPKPIAVRYGWSNWFQATLFNTNLLPVSSFRTDNWGDVKRATEIPVQK